MARLYILPGLIGPDDEPDLLPLLNRIPGFGRARVRGLDLAAAGEMPPGPLWLGMQPGEGVLEPGPLRVAALGFDPPERSTHFCLDYLTRDGDLIGDRVSAIEPARDLIRVLFRERLHLLAGNEGADALIWEDVAPFLTLSPAEAKGKSLADALPDGERWLRRFVDDAANLLLDAPVNREREDAGLLPIAFAWPWGAGVRPSVPAMPLRFGRPMAFEGLDERLVGLARLAGFRPKATDAIIELRPLLGDFEYREWEVLNRLPATLAPVFRDPSEPVALVLPDALEATSGLWLSFLPGEDGEFELRREILTDPRVPTVPLPGAIPPFFRATQP